MTPKGFIHFGGTPPIPIVPNKDFISESYGDEFYKMAWYLVGPTIRANQHIKVIDQHQLYCIAFIEGMRMAISNLKDKEVKDEPLSSGSVYAPQESHGRIQEMGSERGVVYLGYPDPSNL